MKASVSHWMGHEVFYDSRFGICSTSLQQTLPLSTTQSYIYRAILAWMGLEILGVHWGLSKHVRSPQTEEAIGKWLEGIISFTSRSWASHFLGQRACPIRNTNGARLASAIAAEKLDEFGNTVQPRRPHGQSQNTRIKHKQDAAKDVTDACKESSTWFVQNPHIFLTHCIYIPFTVFHRRRP